MIKEIPIVIPSMGRPDLLNTHKVFFPERISVCVPDSEVKSYEKAHPNLEIVGHPDSVIGISAKRQWIYENWGDVVMIDDDIGKVVHLEHKTGDKACKLDMDEATDLVDRLAWETAQLGAFLFGVASSADPRNYVPMTPYRTAGWVNGGFTGLLAGSKLSYNSEIMCTEDFWISALNAHFHRKCWVDTRYALVDVTGNGTAKTVGGMSYTRNLEREENDNKILRQFFGDAITKHKKASVGRVGDIHEHQRALSVPWA
jgi:hypothetical protein